MDRRHFVIITTRVVALYLAVAIVDWCLEYAVAGRHHYSPALLLVGGLLALLIPLLLWTCTVSVSRLVLRGLGGSLQEAAVSARCAEIVALMLLGIVTAARAIPSLIYSLGFSMSVFDHSLHIEDAGLFQEAVAGGLIGLVLLGRPRFLLEATEKLQGVKRERPDDPRIT